MDGIVQRLDADARRRADQSIAPLLIDGFKAVGMDTTKIPKVWSQKPAKKRRQ